MRYTLRLVEIRDPHNRKLIIRRLVSDLSIDFQKAEFLANRLPVDVMHHATEDEIQKTVFDYERLGCRVTKISEKEEHHEVPPRAEPPKTDPVPAHAHIDTTAHVTTGPIKFSVRTEEPGKKKKDRQRLLLQVAALSAILLALFLVLYFSGTRKASLKTQLAGNVSQPPAASLDPAETSGPEEEATDSALAQADSAGSFDEKVEVLEDALAKTPKSEAVKQKMSDAYEEKAKQEFEPDGRIRFYLMAIEFNPYNEGAWDGLIQAYIEAGKTGKSEDAKRDKEARFREAHVKLNRLLSSLGTLEGMPKIMGGMLAFTYRSEKKDEKSVLSEMKHLAVRIRGIRNFQNISITAMADGQKMVREF